MARSFIILWMLFPWVLNAQSDRPDWEGGIPDGCTSITLGKKATVDGSVITSHTDDSHRTTSAINIVRRMTYSKGAMVTMYRRVACDTTAMPSYQNIEIGSIPQLSNTNGYINSAYPCMNDRQVGIGESTFGGREELVSEAGLIDCQRLCRLMLERASSAREAIRIAGELTGRYGWNDAGECLTISDKNEVWHFEIVGPGKGKVGSIWVAQRVPDEHISVNANASRIRKIDLSRPDEFMASENVFDLALEKGWCTSKEDFEFCYAYAPESRRELASRRREWRVLSLAAPSLGLDPNAENFPFSVKPDKLIALPDLVRMFQDYYEGTPFDMTKDMTVTDENGKTVISPLANPHMPYDANKLFKVNGGWGWRGERTITRWYTMYATIIQSRNWLPDEIGGVVWLAMDNVSTSVYIPVYCSVTDLPAPYKVDGRMTGFAPRECAWWAFNYLGTMTAQRWGDMRHDVEKLWIPIQAELFDRQPEVEKKALELYRDDKASAINFLTDYTSGWGYFVVEKAWKMGDYLWTKYDESF